MPRLITILTILLFSVLSQVVMASSSLISTVQKQQILDDIKWQRLMYAEQQAISDVVFSGYFYHPQGREKLAEELEANIAQLWQFAEPNQSIRCRFPARSQYLIEKLHIQLSDLPKAQCPEFDQWISTIQPEKIVLIYATDFMGNPSSMFGHTLLRIDPKQQSQLNLVSYAVNYAATVPPEHSWSYAWKGLTGQYPGEYSLMPYYHKVKEYGDFESRDLWEYELDLTSDEARFLVAHLWEMKQVSFPYYFVSDNCAYRLLGLIDLVRPMLNLKQQFKQRTIPVESLKALADANLVKHMVYRPALETQLLVQAKAHGADLARQARQLAQYDPSEIPLLLKHYDEFEQAQILEMAYDYLYLQLLGRRVHASQAQQQLRYFLSLRSQLDISKQRPMPESPKSDPTLGHHAQKSTISIGEIQQQPTINLGFRWAYHDLSDPIAGYRLGTQLNFLHGDVQLRENQLKLSRLNLLSVQSYTAIHPFKAPLSWGFDLGWQQEAQHHGEFDPRHQHGVFNINTQWGYSQSDLNQQHLCFAQAQIHLQAGRHLKHSWRSGLGPVLGCQNIWTSHLQSVLQVQFPYWQDQQQWQLKTMLELNYQLKKQQTLGVKYHYERQNQLDWHAIKMTYQYFFQ